MQYRTLNPATEELIESYPVAIAEQLEGALDAAALAADGWRRTPIGDRAARLEAAAAELQHRSVELAGIMATEMGKPLDQGAAEADKCAWGCRYFAERAPRFLEPVSHTTDGSETFVRYDPLGPILAIMPWNFPFWQFFRFAAPALMAGNIVL